MPEPFVYHRTRSGADLVRRRSRVEPLLGRMGLLGGQMAVARKRMSYSLTGTMMLLPK